MSDTAHIMQVKQVCPMPLHKTTLRTPDWTDIAVAIAVGLLFVGSFRANQYLDDLMIYAPGISLIFIPAGIKLLCLLVGGAPAVAGIFVSGIYLSLTLWTAKALSFSLLIATIGVASYGLAVYGVKRRFKIEHSLANLNFWHILLLSACAGFLNGLGVNLAYFPAASTATTSCCAMCWPWPTATFWVASSSSCCSMPRFWPCVKYAPWQGNWY